MSERLFEYRNQWITREKGRNGFFRNWYDQSRRRTVRKKLAAGDIQSAKDELVAILTTATPKIKSPQSVRLADCLAHYITHKAEPQGSKQASQARRASQLTLDAVMRDIPHPTVAHLTRLKQQEIWRYMADEYDLVAKSIKTYMIAIRAAVNFAATPQIIMIDDQRHEVRLLSETVPIFCSHQEIADILNQSVTKAREWIPTFQELGKWIDHVEEEDDFRTVVLMLNTWARNEAIFDFRLDQVDWEYGTLDLNPAGRKQTKKRRPHIRMTTALAAWLQHWNDHRPIRQYQDTVEKRINAIGKKIGLPDMTLYVLRHFMATQSRRTSFPVSREQRSLWLGHTVKGGSSTTQWYEKFDSDYLEEPMRATEEIIRRIDKHTQKTLFAPTMHPQASLREVR